MILGMSKATYTLLHVLISASIVLVIFAALTVFAAIRFHPERVGAA